MRKLLLVHNVTYYYVAKFGSVGFGLLLCNNWVIKGMTLSTAQRVWKTEAALTRCARSTPRRTLTVQYIVVGLTMLKLQSELS